MPFCVLHCVDHCCAHHTETCKDLENSSDVKTSPLSKGEELAEKQEQREYAEDDRQDHGGLDRL